MKQHLNDFDKGTAASVTATLLGFSNCRLQSAAGFRNTWREINRLNLFDNCVTMGQFLKVYCDYVSRFN